MTIAIVMLTGAVSLVAAEPQRPKVPENRAIASLGVALNEHAAVVVVGPKVFVAPASIRHQPGTLAVATFSARQPTALLALSARAAKVGISAMSSRDATVQFRLPGAIEGDEVDGGQLISLVLTSEDDHALRDLLSGQGLTLRDGGQARKLPEFFTAVLCNSTQEFSRQDAAALEKIDSPSGVRVLRFVAGSSAAVDYAAAHPDEKYIVIAESAGLSVNALKALAGSNIVAVVVGHYRAADVRPEDFAQAAEDVKRAVKAIRLVSDAPVLLAVSVTNEFTRKMEKSWPQAFGDDLAGFDGWAVYNLALFPAIIEAPANPRKLVMDRLGLGALGEKPCVLIEFMGTRYNYRPADAEYIRKVWRAKAPLLLKAMTRQEWRGLVVWSHNIDDAALKAEALRAVTGKR
jgi:nitrogen regulatory protein PII-like uncharacterized protein